jgi:hypothetical protein
MTTTMNVLQDACRAAGMKRSPPDTPARAVYSARQRRSVADRAGQGSAGVLFRIDRCPECPRPGAARYEPPRAAGPRIRSLTETHRLRVRYAPPSPRQLRVLHRFRRQDSDRVPPILPSAPAATRRRQAQADGMGIAHLMNRAISLPGVRLGWQPDSRMRESSRLISAVGSPAGR